MTPDEISKDGERRWVFLAWWVGLSTVTAIGALYVVAALVARLHLTSEDVINYVIVLPIGLLWALIHSPIFWIVAAQIWFLVMFNSIRAAWQTHRDQQQRIIELLKEIDRNERARYTALAEKVEQCARTLAQEYREHQYEKTTP